jgi:hypothetical protein
MIALNDRRKVAAPKKRGSTTKPRKTSSKQQAANRRNAKKSTGPKTQAGKERSRQNALKHGLFAGHLPLSSAPFMRNEEECRQLVEQFIEDFQPRSQVEITMIESLAVDFMRLRHIHALEGAIWDNQAGVESNIRKLIPWLKRAYYFDLSLEEGAA